MEYSDLYLKVRNPGNYLGNEINAVKKDHNRVSLKMALAFPDLYEIGSSHFGIQILYDIVNNQEDMCAERVFVPAPDLREELKNKNMLLRTLESKKPLKDFDMIGFSLLYELNYTGVAEILDLSDIPYYAADRDDSYPLIMAGGPCMVNPEPIADFFDIIFIGDGEEGIVEKAELYKKLKIEQGLSKKEILLQMKDIKGVYVPSLFEDKDGNNLFLDNKLEDYKKVNKRIISDLETAAFPIAPIIPYGKPVHDRLRLEISRGCSRGCRFCQAGMIYRPVRERSVETLLEITKKSIEKTGYEDLSLLSLSTGDYTCFPELLFHLMKKYQKEARSVSLPSIRAGRLTSDLMEEISKVRKTGFTIAPEAGSQRLRNVINKDLSEDDIVTTVQSAFEMGWQLIKLYFMIGLPTETQEDLDGMIELVKKLKFLPEAKKCQINVSLTTFIPKPHTPFQWKRQIPREESMEKFLYLKNNLKIRGIKVKWQDPEHSRLEGLFARGDRSLSSLIVRAYESGCHLDGWSDYFQFDTWMKCIEEENIDIDYFIRERDINEPLPWDKVDIGVTKKYLQSEYAKGLEEAVTRDCRFDKCSGCGVCDFKEIYPKMFNTADIETLDDSQAEPKGEVIKLKIKFAKKGMGRFFGHLELISIFQRALDRANVKFDFTKGFHPKPKMMFRDTLPLGMESDCELLLVDCFECNVEDIMNKLNNTLPQGLVIKDIEKKDKKYRFVQNSYSHYEITFDDDYALEEKVQSFESVESFDITLVKKGKDRIYNLKDWFKEIKILEKNKLYMKIYSENGKTLRPEIFLKQVIHADDDKIKKIQIYKILETDIN